ncbi:hypothetical protein BJX68DRAFT_187134 [Aspergillus pseudodeflectus]|uniref:Uncharacterized protein n=1 Tax=Aspergillus pseudodeflectus TaxID=176178 RepID=A0ABR4JKA7_9EURO
MKMPSVDVAVTSPASAEHPDRLLFKAHKSLPRRVDANPNPVAQTSSPRHDGQSSNGLPVATAPNLPLTPPGIAMDDSPTEAEMQKATPHSGLATLTPSKPSHPPTPETTPPRSMITNRPGLGHFGYISSSSRAESFQTAYERMSDSETEAVTPRPSPPSLSRSTTQKSTRSTRSTKSTRSTRSKGGTDPRTRETTPAGDQSPSFRASSRSSKIPVDALYQSYGKKSPTAVPCRQVSSSGQVPELRIKPTRERSTQSRNGTDADTSNVDGSTRGRRSLRDRVAHVQHFDDNTALDQFRQQIGWPSADDQLGPPEREDSRRLSGVSTSSTVEAMIIDTTPKPARRALRHSGKRLSLRSASSPITRSERTSIASSSDLQRRLSHKTARITENDRRSIVSEISISGSSTLGAPQQSVDVVPVIVIPQRSSSLNRPSNATSRNPSVSRSLASSRAPSAPKNRPGSLDLPRQRKRTLSEPHAANVADTRGRTLNRPYIPPRSSSLSAPTSQNNSRTTSLTSESLRSHNLAVEQGMKRQQEPTNLAPAPVSVPVAAPAPVPALDAPGHARHDSADLPKTQSILIGVEDLSYLRPPSVLFTPHSIPSSSPGPFEINEVRRVAIFPHNNESLLLVNPLGQFGLREQLRPVNLPQTPEMVQEPIADVDSPLRNPRPPPQPPISTAIRENELDLNQPLGEGNAEPEATGGLNRRPGYKRRGWIGRPRSESFNSFVRSLSLNSAKNPKAGEDIDGRLQPFWRPRRFWDDSPENLSPEEENGAETQNTKQPDEVISNSLGMPQRRLVFDGPTLSPSRHGAKRGIVGHHRANRDALVGSRILTQEALYSQTSLHQRQFPAVSWWRLRFRSGIVRSLRWRLRRSMQRRAEDRREARREKLKQSIGEAVLVNSSIHVRRTTVQT